MKLLQNQVLNYKNDKSPKRDKKLVTRDSFYERTSSSSGGHQEAAPPSPTPDYGLSVSRKHVSKSISSLLESNKDEQLSLCKKMSESSLELRSSPNIPVPDYEGNDLKACACETMTLFLCRREKEKSFVKIPKV